MPSSAKSYPHPHPYIKPPPLRRNNARPGIARRPPRKVGGVQQVVDAGLQAEAAKLVAGRGIHHAVGRDEAAGSVGHEFRIGGVAVVPADVGVEVTQAQAFPAEGQACFDGDRRNELHLVADELPLAADVFSPQVAQVDE